MILYTKYKFTLIKTLISLPLLLLCFAAFSQKGINETNQNIEKFDKLTFKFFFQAPSLTLDISDENQVANAIHYRPNSLSSWGGSASWKYFYLVLSFNNKKSAEENIKYGTTRFKDLQFSYFKKKFGADFYYQNYRGYYISNSKIFSPAWNSSLPYLNNPHLQIRPYGFNAYYISSDKFSYKAAFDQSERQKKSAGSFILMFTNQFMLIKSDESLVPTNEQSKYALLSPLRKANFWNIQLSPGYAYSYIYEKLFFTPALFLGGGLQRQSCDLENVKSKLNLCYKANAKFSTGFNSKRFLFGAYALFDLSFANICKANFSTTSSQYCLSVGFRI